MVSIRLMQTEDLDSLAHIYVRAFEAEEINEHWTAPSARALLEHWLQRQPDLAFVAESDGRVVGGFVVGIRPWWDGNHLVDGEFFVDAGSQGQGIGRELMRTVLRAAERKYAPVVWDSYTFRGQKFPLDWYQRLGFREIDEWMMIRADMAELLSKLQ